MKIAIVGATGMVGGMFLTVLAEKTLNTKPSTLGEERLKGAEYVLFASAKSAGKVVDFMGKPHTVVELTDENIKKHKVDFALFSAGGGTSGRFAPIFAENGAIVIDNSSFWRMDKDVPLVVPQVNPKAAFTHKKGIIANPNCSTIQAVVALNPLHKKYGLKRVIYSTYQAVSGAGVAGFSDLDEAAKAYANGTDCAPKKFAHPIFSNVIPHIDTFLPNGYTKEEQKMIDETHKILEDENIKITATTARVPVFNGHSESINAEFLKPCTLAGVFDALKSQPALTVLDDPANNLYPMPINSNGYDGVFVGRVRLDESVASGVNMWVVADNIRKGAATNAVEILELFL